MVITKQSMNNLDVSEAHKLHCNEISLVMVHILQQLMADSNLLLMPPRSTMILQSFTAPYTVKNCFSSVSFDCNISIQFHENNVTTSQHDIIQLFQLKQCPHKQGYHKHCLTVLQSDVGKLIIASVSQTPSFLSLIHRYRLKIY